VIIGVMRGLLENLVILADIRKKALNNINNI